MNMRALKSNKQISKNRKSLRNWKRSRKNIKTKFSSKYSEKKSYLNLKKTSTAKNLRIELISLQSLRINGIVVKFLCN